MAGMALVLWRMLPAPSPASVSGGYFALLRSVLQLFLSERTLRVRGCSGCSSSQPSACSGPPWSCRFAYPNRAIWLCRRSFGLCALPAIFFVRKPDVPRRFIILYGFVAGSSPPCSHAFALHDDPNAKVGSSCTSGRSPGSRRQMLQSFGICPIRATISLTTCRSSMNWSTVLNSLSLCPVYFTPGIARPNCTPLGRS